MKETSMRAASWILALVFVSPSAAPAGAAPAGSEGKAEEATFSVEDLHVGSTYVVLCAQAGGEEWLGVARRLASARQARALVVFDTGRPGDLLPLLTKLAPDNVAYVIPPKLITPHLAGKLAELSSRIQPDKLIDYGSGYVTGVTAGDALTLVERTLAREAADGPIPRFCTGVGHSWQRNERVFRHMHHIMARHVDECRERGFDGTAVEALGSDASSRNLLLLMPLSKGGLILFGGHGSGSASCLVGIDDLKTLVIGPSIVLNGTCFGAATHRLVKYGDAKKAHGLWRAIDPKGSFALQMLRRGSLGYIGGSASCSFGHVEPAITLLRDDHVSLGQALRAIQNGFIEPVPVEHWDAGGMRPGDPGFPKIPKGDRKIGLAHPTMIQYTIRTICLGDPAFVPFPK